MRYNYHMKHFYQSLIHISLIGSLLAGSGGVAFAQTRIAPTNIIPETVKDAVRPTAPLEVDAIRSIAPSRERGDAVREAAEGQADRVRQVIETRVSDLRIRLDERKIHLREEIDEKRAEFEARVKEAREEREVKIEEKRAELRERVAQIQDAQKRRVVERIDQKIDELNKRLTNHWISALERMEELLAKLSSRADKAEENGNDVSATRAAVERAKAAIATARAAVEAQAAKTYAIDFTDETTLGEAISAAQHALRNDLQSVRETLVAARQAIAEALGSLQRVPDVDKEPEEDEEEQEEEKESEEE